MAKAKHHYVNNKTLYEEMVKHRAKVLDSRANEKPLPQLSNYIGECFLMICNKLASKFNFVNYTYKDEMIADGIENCVASAHNFDPTKSTNPFAYFTMIAWNAFLRRIAKEKKQTYVKHKNFEYSNLMDSLLEESTMTGQSHNNEYSSDVIRNFEEKLVKTQKKTKTGIEKFVEENKNEELTLNTSEHI